MHLGALPPAFAGLEEADAVEAAGFLQPLALEAGEVILEQGDEDYTLAFVVQGAVQLIDQNVKVGAAASRDILGEVELFAQVPRTASATASAPTHLSVLAFEHWQELCSRGSPAVFNVERYGHRRISERLRYLNERIPDKTKGTPLALPARKSGGMLGSISRLLGGGPRVPSIDIPLFLAQNPLFGWADEAILAEIGGLFKVERFDAGSTVCRQGEVGDRIYLLVEGEVDVAVFIGGDKSGPQHAERIATLQPGQAFGDASLAQHAPRTASCVCSQEVIALTMTRDHYGALFASNDPTGSVFRQAMLRNLIHQLQATQDRYVQIMLALSPSQDETIRGTPLNMVWRD